MQQPAERLDKARGTRLRIEHLGCQDNVGALERLQIYCDQYICTGGQLAELALGRDRFVLDVRPLVYRKLGVDSALACRPYDLAAWLVGQQAGCVICDPFGAPLDAPLDVTTNVACAVYANHALADLLIPIVREEVTRLLC